MTGQPETAILPQTALLSYAEALNWIAFRKACEDDLVGACDPGILRVLECMRDGAPLWPSTPAPGGTPEWAIVNIPSPGVAADIERANVLIRSDERSLAELAADMRIKVEAWRLRRDLHESAWSALNEAIEGQEIAPKPSRDIGEYKSRSSPGLFFKMQNPGSKEGWFESKRLLELWPAPKAQEKPPIPKARLLRFHLEYVSEQAAKPGKPSRKEHEAAIAAHFPGHRPIGTRQLTALRSRPETPKCWTKAGRRKRSGGNSNQNGK